MSGRHRPTRLLRNRAIRTPLVVIGALSLIAAGSVILRTVTADAGGCSSSSGIKLAVAADPAIAPAISEIATAWGATRPTVNDECVRVEVVAKASHQMAENLATWSGGWVDVAAKPAPTPAESDLPPAWIPDSSYWIGRVSEVDRELFEGDGTSIAASPIVLAVPESVARAMAGQLPQGRLDTATISKLALDPNNKNPLKIGMVEPRRDTAGMVGAMVISDAVVAAPKDLPRLVLSYRNVGALVNDVQALWESFGRGITGAPVSEQAVLAYNTSNTASPMAAVPLTDVPTLDYPFILRSRQSRAITAAAAAFRGALTSQQYRNVLARHKLRLPDGSAAPGFPTGHGVTTALVHVQPLQDMARVASALRIWVAARTPSRVLAMVDATASMNNPLGARTRMQVMREAASQGLALFTDVSEIGLWAYAGPGHQELAPLAPLNKPGQRETLLAKVNAANPAPTDVTPLYASIKAGYQELLNNYKPELRNTLVVFTDGRDNTGTGLRQTQRELEVLADVTRYIRVVLLGIGPDVNMNELKAIADTTGGAAFQVNSPEEMQLIFLQALLT
ncbi:MAG TPA: VWA domain-containing protein [Candidatus Limnocylindrales bacterium]|nr:VWA domain-containing protein [Candidatus Limnocylindrales bacterium]